ncbi:MAG: hypothetical protein IAE67_10715 [Candidatus Competibacteraceae bacterium]|nr:hypothetical protein [Candidatus Competibacteraceae bacterium]
MKQVKKMNLVLMVAVLGFGITVSSCSKKCENEDPKARIINNGTETASAQIKTSGGNTININGIEPNDTSAYSSFAPGDIKVTVAVGNTDWIDTIAMGYCFEYDIIIDANNNVSSVAHDLND